jgi:hypothetical protein
MRYAVSLDTAAFEEAIGKLPDRQMIEEARVALRREFAGRPRFEPMGDDLEQAAELARVYREIARAIAEDGDDSDVAADD